MTEKGVTIEITPIDYVTVGNYPQLSTRATVKDVKVDKIVSVPNVLLETTLVLKITNNT